jgi:hypothetical protein
MMIVELLQKKKLKIQKSPSSARETGEKSSVKF